MDKKAQGISMNVIIIAALALLVLVVLSVIFLGRMGPWNQQVDSCSNKGGSCYDIRNSNCASESNDRFTTPMSIYKCSNADETCCVNVGASQ